MPQLRHLRPTGRWLSGELFRPDQPATETFGDVLGALPAKQIMPLLMSFDREAKAIEGLPDWTRGALLNGRYGFERDLQFLPSVPAAGEIDVALLA